MNYYLSIKWSTSRGRDTYGYNICTARCERMYVEKSDTSGGVIPAGRWATCGGGYDMHGTVVGAFLADRYQDRLREIRGRACATHGKDRPYTTHDLAPDASRTLYGMAWNLDTNRVSLDGACGINCMADIAAIIGVRMTPTLDRKGHVTGYMVDDSAERAAA